MGTVSHVTRFSLQTNKICRAARILVTWAPTNRAMTTLPKMTGPTATKTTMMTATTALAMTGMRMETPAMRTMSRGTAGRRTMTGTGPTTELCGTFVDNKYLQLFILTKFIHE